MSFGTLGPSCVLRALRNDSGGLSGTAVPKGDGACRVRRHGLSGLRAGALQEPSRPFSSPTRFASAFGLRQQELADLAGVQRATVSAALGNSKLQKFMRDARRVISAAMRCSPTDRTRFIGFATPQARNSHTARRSSWCPAGRWTRSFRTWSRPGPVLRDDPHRSLGVKSLLSMGLAYQMFLIGQGDRLHRLPVRKFEAMLADPETQPFPQFAGQRVR